MIVSEIELIDKAVEASNSALCNREGGVEIRHGDSIGLGRIVLIEDDSGRRDFDGAIGPSSCGSPNGERGSSVDVSRGNGELELVVRSQRDSEDSIAAIE